jgi:hypothetical protein
LNELRSSSEIGSGFRIGFSPMGLRLFGFWLLALLLFVAAWAWRPHEQAQTPLPLGPSPLAESILDEPAPPERTGFSKLLHERLLDRDDSWTAMKLAQRHLREHPEVSVYDAVFRMGAKFQYPPSSLLGFELVQSIFGRGALANPVLNCLSVCFFVLFAVATYLIARPGLVPPRRALLDHALPFMFVVLCYPLLKALEIGQIQSYLNGLFALALLSFTRGRTIAAGLLVGVMATIKPQMGLFLLWALLQPIRQACQQTSTVGLADTQVPLAQIPACRKSRIDQDVTQQGCAGKPGEPMTTECCQGRPVHVARASRSNTLTASSSRE